MRQILMSEWFKVGKPDDFPESQCVYLDETPLGEVVIIQQNGNFHALRGICSHEYFEFDDVPVQEGQLTCPLHFSAFDITTGEALNPPAEDPLEVFDIKIQDNYIWIKSKQ